MSSNQANQQKEVRRVSSAGSDRLGELHMGSPGDKFDPIEFQREMGKKLIKLQRLNKINKNIVLIERQIKFKSMNIFFNRGGSNLC